MDKELKDKLRLFKIDVLNILHVLAVSEAIAVELDKISTSTSTAESDLKGIISTLRRIKYKDESLIQPAGRDIDGRLRWQINQNVVDKNELAIFLEKEILGDMISRG